MMPAPYSEDLRQKVIAALDRGERKTDVSRIFNISRNTLDLWFARQSETGSCRSKVRVTNPKTEISDWERFRKFVKQHGSKTQIEIAKLWGEMDIEKEMK